jgi:hypothetical protein
MENHEFSKGILDFSKSVVKTSFDALGAFSAQAARMADSVLGMAPSAPEEGKRAVGIYFQESQKVLANLRKYVDTELELNTTAKDAPVKNLEALETLYNDLFSQAVEIKNEANSLLEKGTGQLSKEATSVVDLWRESVDGGFELFHKCMSRDFELTRKAFTGVFAYPRPAEDGADNAK